MTSERFLSLGMVLLAQGGDGAGDGGIKVILPFMIVLGVLFYLMVLRPENKRRSESEQMRKDLKKNDRVLTIGGIYGTVVNIHGDTGDVTIKVDENSNTRMRITRSSIGQIIKESDDEEKAKSV